MAVSIPAGPDPPAILVVDDQEGVRRLLSEVFSIKGYKVLLAAAGEEALALADRYLPALVLLDLRMPGMNGLETLVRLKREHPAVPVVIMTAVNDEDARRAVTAGAVCAISKPFDVHKLQTLVDSLVVTDQVAAAEEETPYGSGPAEREDD